MSLLIAFTILLLLKSRVFDKLFLSIAYTEMSKLFDYLSSYSNLLYAVISLYFDLAEALRNKQLMYS